MASHSSRSVLFGVVAGLFLAAGLVLSAMLVTRAWLKISEAQEITVTGSARKNIRSDLAVWIGSFSVEGTNLAEAQGRLKTDLAKLESFLRANNFTNYTISPINIQALKARESGDPEAQRTVGYRLTQKATIESPEVESVMKLDRDSTALVANGLVFTPAPIGFIYTKSAEAKVEMLADATRDARARADQIALQGGRRIKELRSARMGVFQITALHSNETSGLGVNDTTSLEKTITAVVNTTFRLE